MERFIKIASNVQFDVAVDEHFAIIKSLQTYTAI